jgi:hypothetical protein
MRQSHRNTPVEEHVGLGRLNVAGTDLLGKAVIHAKPPVVSILTGKQDGGYQDGGIGNSPIVSRVVHKGDVVPATIAPDVRHHRRQRVLCSFFHCSCSQRLSFLLIHLCEREREIAIARTWR